MRDAYPVRIHARKNRVKSEPDRYPSAMETGLAADASEMDEPVALMGYDHGVRRRLFAFAAAVSLVLFLATTVLWVRGNRRWTGLIFRWQGLDLSIASNHGRFLVDNLPEILNFHVARQRMVRLLQSRDAAKGRLVRYEDAISHNRTLVAIGSVADPAYLRIAVPCWLTEMFLLILPVAWLLFVYRQRMRCPDGCITCGYNLTGNISGVCPECGTPIRSKFEVMT
jgi:hypothetical protein